MVAIDSDATSSNYDDDGNAYAEYSLAGAKLAQGQTFGIKLETDFKSQGNIQSVLGQTGITVGSSGTQPKFIVAGQLLKIPIRKHETGSTHTLSDENVPTSAMYDEDYLVVKVTNVSTTPFDSNNDAEAVAAFVTVVRPITVGDYDLFSIPGAQYEASGTTFDAHVATGFVEGDKVYACLLYTSPSPRDRG